MVQIKRIEWIDIVKYVCIIMVMLSHLETRTEIWNAFYSPFFLTAFFFTAGYVYKPKNNFKNFLYKKFRQLFIPWLFFSVFDIVLSQVVSFNVHKNLLEELKWNFLQIRGEGDGVWFVAALFVAFIPFYFFVEWYESMPKKVKGKYGYREIKVIILAWILSFASILYVRLMTTHFFPWNSAALPWHFAYMFQAMFYMILGYIFHQNVEGKFDRYNGSKTRMIVLIIYLLLVFIPILREIRMSMIIDIMYEYLESIVGITLLIMVTKVIKSNKYINYVGQNTLIYFALHGKVYSVIQTLLTKFVPCFYTMVLSSTVLSSIFCLGLSIFLSVVLIIPAYIINRWFPFIVGRKKFYV